MKINIGVCLVALTAIGTSCNKDEMEKIPTILDKLEGDWIFEQAILDGGLAEESWSQTTTEIRAESDSTLKLISDNQPTKRLKIWPVESILTLQESISNIVFYRDDGIIVQVSSFADENKVAMILMPPRGWSYTDECDESDVNGFQCSSEGTWQFNLIKMN